MSSLLFLRYLEILSTFISTSFAKLNRARKCFCFHQKTWREVNRFPSKHFVDQSNHNLSSKRTFDSFSRFSRSFIFLLCFSPNPLKGFLFQQWRMAIREKVREREVMAFIQVVKSLKASFVFFTLNSSADLLEPSSSLTDTENDVAHHLPRVSTSRDADQSLVSVDVSERSSLFNEF